MPPSRPRPCLCGSTRAPTLAPGGPPGWACSSFVSGAVPSRTAPVGATVAAAPRAIPGDARTRPAAPPGSPLPRSLPAASAPPSSPGDASPTWLAFGYWGVRLCCRPQTYLPCEASGTACSGAHPPPAPVGPHLGPPGIPSFCTMLALNPFVYGTWKVSSAPVSVGHTGSGLMARQLRGCLRFAMLSSGPPVQTL